MTVRNGLLGSSGQALGRFNPGYECNGLYRDRPGPMDMVSDKVHASSRKMDKAPRERWTIRYDGPTLVSATFAMGRL